MSLLSTIILIIGFLGLIEGIFISISPKLSIHILRVFMKNKSNIKRAGTIELIVAIILIIIGINI